MSLALAMGTLIEEPGRLAAPRPPLMKRMCSRCELVLGWVVCAEAMAGRVTHGLCAPCVAYSLDEYAAEMAAEYTLDVGGAGSAPRVATPRVCGGATPPHGAVNDNALKAPARPGIRSF
jgi:hypothetical protein